MFFDIETTGLSSARSEIYLIGVLHFDKKEWCFTQFFSENMYDEEEMLEAFSKLVSKKYEEAGKLYLISYNGDNFDIPFMSRCAEQYGIDLGFAKCLSMDLIKKVRPIKKILGLNDCKLKTVERFLGIYREDKFNGGELIELYLEYRRLIQSKDAKANKKAASLLEVLILHNEEDILNMPYLISILSYEALREGAFSVKEYYIEDNILNVDLKLKYKLPRELYIEEKPFVISVSQDGSDYFNFTVELLEGELKYFFPNYKDYFYLIYEDYAVHKSVGEFVDKKSRKQANKKNAYIRKNGLFFEEPDLIYTPVFSEEYNSKTKYAIYEDGIFEDKERLKKYIMAVLKSFL
ncbi:MAG: ribonuclease H-like domain-containing protein [Eubacteriales bacterium]|nr:ribonuclease H-like domain-containing protein [Eubacteriales bacterium]